MLWFHIPYMIIFYDTSNGPQNDVGNYLGPCSIKLAVGIAGIYAPDGRGAPHNYMGCSLLYRGLYKDYYRGY